MEAHRMLQNILLEEYHGISYDTPNNKMHLLVANLQKKFG